MSSSPFETISPPYLVFLKQRKDLLTTNRLLTTHYQEFLSILHQLSNIFTEKRKRRIGDYNVGLLEQFDALLAAEVACLQHAHDVLVVLQEIAHVGEVDGSVAVAVGHFSYLHLVGRFLWFVVPPVEAEYQFSLPVMGEPL